MRNRNPEKIFLFENRSELDGLFMLMDFGQRGEFRPEFIQEIK